jgi:putative glutamine amidotransferase
MDGRRFEPDVIGHGNSKTGESDVETLDNTTKKRAAHDGHGALRAHKGDGNVAVVGQWRKDGTTVVPERYARAVRAAGAEVFVPSTFAPPADEPEDLEILSSLSPDDSSPLDDAGGLVIPGGGDIDPAWYGAEPHPRTRNVSHDRDRFELTLLEEALERDMPVLAICHGMQLLNVCLGGTLDQHLADRPQRLDHDRDLPRAEPIHKLRLKEHCVLAEIFDTTITEVNSHHHQGLERIAEPLEEIGWAEDGVLEAVVSTQHSWVIGVQWHPESMSAVDERQAALFKAFVEAIESLDHARPAARSA